MQSIKKFNDFLMENAYINAYMAEKEPAISKEAEPFIPKKIPDKAVCVCITPELGTKTIETEFWLDAKNFEWRCSGCSEKQFTMFFETDFYKQLCGRLDCCWPKKDKFFIKLRFALRDPKSRNFS